ncbi:hypothetical protein [Silvanigrella aquatica]|uniref:Lipocalin-like domain-containing protein n=1 Tax=Silvanigrella aquatica TaxID=1915309 RepID=A0A1L4D154_9BACT|nr:hypothetical protein [Silvanigrella aquatica]APJ03926.1 hypothetical protein AXG55_08420 [Silvanigrella aquatica]
MTSKYRFLLSLTAFSFVGTACKESPKNKNIDQNDIYHSWTLSKATCQDGTERKFNMTDGSKVEYIFSKENNSKINIFTKALEDASGNLNFVTSNMPYGSFGYNTYNASLPLNPEYGTPNNPNNLVNISISSNAILTITDNKINFIHNAENQLEWRDSVYTARKFAHSIDEKALLSTYNLDGEFVKTDKNTLVIKGTFSKDLVNCSNDPNNFESAVSLTLSK